jgi:hypothetical protein
MYVGREHPPPHFHATASASLVAEWTRLHFDELDAADRFRAIVPETALAIVRSYCERKVPAEHRDELRVECAARGDSITIFEYHPPWRPDVDPSWTRQRVAQLRYEPQNGSWLLYCADRNGRWHAYEPVEPTTKIEQLITEIDADPTGIFWG